MSEQKEESKKTIVSFVVGLLIGGLLVWSFGGDTTNAPTTEDESTDTETVVETEEDEDSTADEADEEPTTTTPPVTTLPTGEGDVTIADRSAGSRLPLASATFPVSEGWVGVRDYTNGQLSGLLGVARFSEAQGLVPTEIILQRATQPGMDYAVVFYTEDGDRTFNLATDVQIEGVFATFTAE